MTASPGRTRRRLPAVPTLLVPALLLLGACTATYGSSVPPESPAAPAPPPPPPAACLLDADALAAATGLTWTADAITASDSRCVYDPAVNAPATPPPPKGVTGEFVAVDVVAASDQPPTAQLDVLAEVCDQGTRTPTARDGFVCRIGEGSVFGGLVRGDQMITVAASAVPPGTTAAALVTAFGQQLDALG